MSVATESAKLSLSLAAMLVKKGILEAEDFNMDSNEVTLILKGITDKLEEEN